MWFNKESDVYICLGVKNFVPDPTPDGYEPFSQLIEKANLWLKDQTDIRLTNMQSLLVQKDLGERKKVFKMNSIQQQPTADSFQLSVGKNSSDGLLMVWEVTATAISNYILKESHLP